MSFRRYWVFWSSILAAVVGAASGLASAGLLVALNHVTDFQTEHGWMLFGLPFAGIVIAWAYSGYGSNAARGNNLLLDQIHAADEVNRIPLRMLPLVLVSTILTHLFGGSAGREGTAVQMGGAIAGWCARALHLSVDHLRVMLMCGISGGFSGVFGTPMAGTVFSMEVVAIGSMRYDALIPCLVAAILADLVVQGIGVHHGIYTVASGFPELSIHVIASVTVAAVAFGLASLLFAEATAFVEHQARSMIENPVLRTFTGGIAIVIVTLLLGTRDYNGLSLPLLNACFAGDSISTFAFLIKLLLTALTLGVGFKGGEVTPLFVIGATLGAVLAGFLGMPQDTLAALGFVAVFAAAANTPIACVVMGAELFGIGGNSIILFGIAVFVAYTISGHHGIYHSQRILTSKYLHPGHPLIGLSLHEASVHRASRVRARRVALRMKKNGGE